MTPISLGLDTFGDVSHGPDGKPQPMDRVLREVLDQATIADEIGIDFIGLGEHHRPDFAISSPESCSPPSRAARIASSLGQPSRFCPRTTRSAFSSAFPP